MDSSRLMKSAQRQPLMSELSVEVVYNADQTLVVFEYIQTDKSAQESPDRVWLCGGKVNEQVTCMLLSHDAWRHFWKRILAVSHSQNHEPFKKGDILCEKREAKQLLG
uniref:AlNc14C263G9838 protein n=1 Tax=Albugo laibachii Nc14 TaxID=890382 RepID=F0WU14_9STRA|nr:AlNc14C263G9838 [Albugo laibachii Nc14]|eukprot:CCA24859.1 AlNc14C263G9838 [Albugo laibachii Nc14]